MKSTPKLSFFLSIDVFFLQFHDFAIARKSFHVGKFLVADDDPDTVFVGGHVLLVELHDILGVDSLQHAGDVGIWVVSVAAHALVGDIRRHIAERGVVVLDIIEYGHAITQFQLLHL